MGIALPGRNISTFKFMQVHPTIDADQPIYWCYYYRSAVKFATVRPFEKTRYKMNVQLSSQAVQPFRVRSRNGAGDARHFQNITGSEDRFR
ncbi:hypothetical protein HMPREF1531_00825 [Propionibacterium sp. oral taxon 192 str. F0372]|nr:hypothetical protein HMPREF1531_00825 [Propionibacterium sp. oral taxon 192 str. F0372]